jgi:hypothetical protein
MVNISKANVFAVKVQISFVNITFDRMNFMTNNQDSLYLDLVRFLDARGMQNTGSDVLKSR